jgi:tetratricopeptide (TPR) repeat protein
MSTSDIQEATPQATTPATSETAKQVEQNGSVTDTIEVNEAASTSTPDSSNANTPVLNGAPVDTKAELTESNGVEADSAEASEGLHESDAPLEIDHRRAKQLLDRAMLLSERGDLAGAILAARQAVSLVSNEPSGYSVLGLLHERAGDLEKAIAAYEKVLHLAPHSTLERDSLDRLKSTLESENSSVLFHFDDNELFEEPPSLPASEPAAATDPVAAKTAGPVAPALSSALPAPAATRPAGATSNVVTPSAPLGQSLPAPATLDPALNSALAARPVAGPPSVLPLTMPAMAQRPSLGLLMRQPSFYFKGAPIVAATTLGLLFMGWAQGVSQSKYLEEMPVGPTPQAQTEVLTSRSDPQPGVSTAANGGNVTGVVPAPTAGSATANGGGIFGTGNANNPAPPSTSVSSTTRTGSTTASGTTAGASSSARPASAGVTGSTGVSGSTGVQPLPPSSAGPVIPQPRGAGASGGSAGPGALEALPPLQPRRQPQEPVRPSAPSAQPASPSAGDNSGANTAGSSTGGGLFNPNSSPRGYIRIDPVRPSSPVRPAARPGNEARAAENAASRAGAAGRTEDVVPNLTRSIERQPTGYGYQRRAMAFMEKGDYARAVDDFQSAISAYQDQIRQNQNVEDARNGIQACRSGQQLAMSRMGR